MIICEPAVRVGCDECGYTLWVEDKLSKRVATHPYHPTCSNSGKAYEIPTFPCAPLPDEYKSDRVRTTPPEAEGD